LIVTAAFCQLSY